VARNAFRALLMSGSDEPQSCEYHVRASDGEDRFITWRGVALRDANNVATGVMLSGEDITDQRRAETEAHRALERMNNVSRLATMGEMAAGISHELNQPLAAIANYAQACARLLRMPSADMPEISGALESVWGRHRATTQSVSGVYGANFAEDAMWEKLRADIDAFAREEGRRPRIMVAKLGQDGHDRGSKVVASAFADLGFDVDIGPLFQTPEEAARQAIENDVHAVGISTLAAGHKTLVPALIDALRKEGAHDIVVFVGGVVPVQDYPMLQAAGVSGIYGPGTAIPVCAADVLAKIRARTATVKT